MQFKFTQLPTELQSIAKRRNLCVDEWISDARVGLGIPFMMQAVYMFLIWSAMYVVVSFATPAPPPEQVENTTWPNPFAVFFRGRLIGWYDPRLLTAVLLALMLVLYWVFR